MSETAASTKRKRGRPRHLDPEHEAALAGLEPHKSQRTIHNQSYMPRLMDVLDLDEQTPLAQWYYGAGARKLTIISELGRVEDPELRRALAEQIYELKLPTAKAVALCRQSRSRWAVERTGALWAEREGSRNRLRDIIIDAINTYLLRYPEMTNEDLVIVLADVRQAIPPDQESLA